MKLLVTGATGFVGTWLTKFLLDRGHDVRVLTRSGQLDFPYETKNIEIAKGDVSDPASLQRAFANVDSVFHLAGVVGYSRAMRQQMITTNVLGTSHIIEAVKRSGCRRLVHMSSVVAVGASFDGHTPLNEESPYNLHHLDLGYFETKHEAELLVKKAVMANEIDAVILNPSTIYGAGDAKKGSRSTQLKVAKGSFPFYTSGGVNVIHIDDVLHGLYRGWEIGQSGERYILSGENISIQKLFQLVATAAGVTAPKIYLPNPIVRGLGLIGDALEKRGRKGPINTENAWASILFHWFDNAKAKRVLGLNPKPAEQAIRESVEWMRETRLIGPGH
jgi:dihydroflavonol-4-reductase